MQRFFFFFKWRRGHFRSDHFGKALSEEWREKRTDSHRHGEHETPTGLIGSKDRRALELELGSPSGSNSLWGSCAEPTEVAFLHLDPASSGAPQPAPLLPVNINIHLACCLFFGAINRPLSGFAFPKERLLGAVLPGHPALHKASTLEIILPFWPLDLAMHFVHSNGCAGNTQVRVLPSWQE